MNDHIKKGDRRMDDANVTSRVAEECDKTVQAIEDMLKDYPVYLASAIIERAQIGIFSRQQIEVPKIRDAVIGRD